MSLVRRELVDTRRNIFKTRCSQWLLAIAKGQTYRTINGVTKRSWALLKVASREKSRVTVDQQIECVDNDLAKWIIRPEWPPNEYPGQYEKSVQHRCVLTECKWPSTNSCRFLNYILCRGYWYKNQFKRTPENSVALGQGTAFEILYYELIRMTISETSNGTIVVRWQENNHRERERESI